jgi:hypothetical protein
MDGRNWSKYNQLIEDASMTNRWKYNFRFGEGQKKKKKLAGKKKM